MWKDITGYTKYFGSTKGENVEIFGTLEWAKCYESVNQSSVGAWLKI